MEGLPIRTDTFLRGEDILYTQFNEVNFYIEDTDQEHLYFHILKKIFHDIKLEKIFPLNGKTNVIDECRKNCGDKNKIFIVDKDFDDILNSKINDLPNLFYLNRYSIENHLVDKSSIYELIREKNPKLKDSDIEQKFDYNKMICDVECLRELSVIFLMIMKHNLQENYFKINCNRDYNITSDFNYKSPDILNYIENIKNKLSANNINYIDEYNNLEEHFNSSEKYLKNIHGKSLLKMIKSYLETLKMINDYSLESFVYILGKNIEANNFMYIKCDVDRYRDI